MKQSEMGKKKEILILIAFVCKVNIAFVILVNVCDSQEGLRRKRLCLQRATISAFQSSAILCLLFTPSEAYLGFAIW